jgi:hypothetical protein
MTVMSRASLSQETMRDGEDEEEVYFGAMDV